MSSSYMKFTNFSIRHHVWILLFTKLYVPLPACRLDKLLTAKKEIYLTLSVGTTSIIASVVKKKL